MKDNRNIIQILTILTVIFTMMGGTFAYWNWSSAVGDRTAIDFTVTDTFACSADGGGNIASNQVLLVPTTCDDEEHAIKREIKVTPTIRLKDLSINLDLWLNITQLDDGLAGSKNFRYALTTSDSSCSTGVVSSGTFYGKSDGGRISILNKNYSLTQTDTYYLYIWLDKAETDSATMNQNFSFSLGGECQDYDGSPEKPVLDDGMIPVTIDENGDVYTIDENNPEWYDYENKEWANVVLVTEEVMLGGSHPRSYYQTNNNVKVAEADILAYYVWIPRYKYRIPYKKCSDIPEAERNMNDYPECYAPYTMSDTDKDKYITIYIEENYWITDDAQQEAYYNEALSELNYALQTGKMVEPYTFYRNGQKISYHSLVSYINAYNNGDTMAGTPTETLPRPTSSAFNVNNILTGTGNEVSIDIAFESADATMAKGDAVNTYYTHPSFWWDDNSNDVVNEGETIAGIWVGKFESTVSGVCAFSQSQENCDDPTIDPFVLPNDIPLTYQTIGNQFATSQNLTKTDNYYGLSNSTTDGHMAKNRDWGAILYLSHSKYGINGEITSNNYLMTDDSSNTSFKTGCGFGEVDPDSWSQNSTTCANQYGTDGLTEYPQSTTGNITGIFDMSGGTEEYVMANYNNQTNEYFSNLPDRKYYDTYSAEQFSNVSSNTILCTLETCGGHALLETKDWYGAITNVVSSDAIWLLRGSDAYGGNAFESNTYIGFDGSNGQSSDYISWRSVLVVRD